MRVQAVARFGVGRGEPVDFALCEGLAEGGGAAELGVALAQLLADLRKAEVSVVDALDIQGDVRARKASGGRGAAGALPECRFDQLPATRAQAAKAAEEAGEMRGGAGQRCGTRFAEDCGQRKLSGAQGGRINARLSAGAGVRRQPPRLTSGV